MKNFGVIKSMHLLKLGGHFRLKNESALKEPSHILLDYLKIVPALYGTIVIFGVIANRPVFYAWGLEFFQIASITDIALSGISLHFPAVAQLGGIFIGLYLAGLLKPDSWWPYALSFVCLIFSVGILVIFVEHRYYVCCWIGILIGFVLFGITHSSYLQRTPRRRKILLLIFPLLSVDLVSLEFIDKATTKHISDGFENDALITISNNTGALQSDKSGTPQGQVMWMGSNAIVVRAKTNKSCMFTYYVLRNPGSLYLKSVRERSSYIRPEFKKAKYYPPMDTDTCPPRKRGQ